MRIRKVILYNFRSFGKEQEIYLNDNTVFVGNNSTGKTSVLQAFAKIFSTSANERNIRKEDFYISKSENPTEIMERKLYIEVSFEFPELKEKDANKSAVPEFFEQLVINEPGALPYMRIRLEAEWYKSSTVEGTIDSTINFITVAEGEEIEENSKRPAKRIELDKIRYIYVPAVRNPEMQLRNVSGTMMNRILTGIIWKEATKDNARKQIEQLNLILDGEDGIGVLKENIKNQWKEYDSDNRYSNAELKFNDTDINSIMKKMEIIFTPGISDKEYRITEMGDGLRSLFYISMVNSMLDIENSIKDNIKNGKENSFNIEPPVFTLIAYEEPENHIAPHLLGKLMNKFNEISQKDNTQVVVTSHSASIIRRVEPENIRYFRLDDSEWNSIVKKLSLPDNETEENRYKYVKEAIKSYPEIYFAKLVILGEGDSEEIVIPKFIEIMGKKVDSSGLSIVPLGGRHVNHFWRLLSDLQIPYITLLDLDLEREGGGWGRIHYAITQLALCGFDKKELLGGVSEQIFDQMPTREYDKKDMQVWIEWLEKYNVFYSNPLDLDFMMIESYKDAYLSVLDTKEGPYIPGFGKISELERKDSMSIDESREYLQRVQHDVNQTLKKCGGSGNCYTEKQRALMIWYNYFFLNRGKPTTHFVALANMESEKLVSNMPEVIKKILLRMEEMFE